jgi:hypothetical protein
LNVPVGPAAALAEAAAPDGAAEPAAVAALVGAAELAAFVQAATMPPRPTTAPAAPIAFRKFRRLMSRI